MKTALLFPGLDALFVPAKLKRWIEHPSVQIRLAEASRYLSRETNSNEDLLLMLTTASRGRLDFDRMLVALTALQVGIVDALKEVETWDLVLGCSHGDFARSVVCEILTLEQAVKLIWTFVQIRNDCPAGETANVRTTDGTALSSQQIQWMTEMGGSFTRWSDLHGTVAGEKASIANLSLSARERGLKVKTVFPFAVHSPVMAPVATHFVAKAADIKIATPIYPVFSSVYVKFLESEFEIQMEAIAGALQTIPWIETLEALCTEHEVTRFLNVGPSNTLTGWTLNNPKLVQAQVTDAWDLLQVTEVAV